MPDDTAEQKRHRKPQATHQQLLEIQRLYVYHSTNQAWIAERLDLSKQEVSKYIALNHAEWVKQRLLCQDEINQRHAEIARSELELRRRYLALAHEAATFAKPEDALRALRSIGSSKDTASVERQAAGMTTETTTLRVQDERVLGQQQAILDELRKPKPGGGCQAAAGVVQLPTLDPACGAEPDPRD